jgi:hypothetical protein
MNVLPSLEPKISDETYDAIKHNFEMLLYSEFEQDGDELDSEQVTDEDLRKAIRISKDQHEEYEEFVKEKTQKLGKTVPVVSAPVGEESWPVRISASYLIFQAITWTGRLFSKEIDIRKHLIDRLAFEETSNDAQINHIRENWNLTFYRTSQIVRILVMCYVYEYSEDFFKFSMEVGFTFREHPPLDALDKVKDKYGGDASLPIIESKKKQYPY